MNKLLVIIGACIVFLVVMAILLVFFLEYQPYLYPDEVFYKERNGEYKDGDAVKVIYGYAEIEDTNIAQLTVIVLYEDATKTSVLLPGYILKNDPYGTENLINQYYLSADFGITIVYDSFSTGYQSWEIVSHWDKSI